jgi:hypothetical protein
MKRHDCCLADAEDVQGQQRGGGRSLDLSGKQSPFPEIK